MAVLTAFVSFVIGIGLLTLLVLAAVHRSGIRYLLQRAELVSGREFAGPLPTRAVRAVEALIDRLTSQEHRLQSLHAISGLPTREPLAARMGADKLGVLAVVSCKDYDRLCAFDPQQAERLLLHIVGRISEMLAPSRLLAQIDRSHLAIWVGPEVEPHVAEAEIDAMTYALGNRLLDGEREILPEIVSRKARFDASRTSPHSTISQTLSTFSLPAESGPTNVAGIDLRAQARERFQLEQDLRQAIARNQLRIRYQPLIDAARGRVCGAEALIRWDHPQRGLIPPSRFIPIAESAGLAQEIGLWALNQAARDVRSWELAKLSDLRVAVNVTSQQLDAPDLPLMIARTLERHSITPQSLEVELTESVALADGRAASALCDELRRQGVKIAIDDFGTGYSSLSALLTLAFDKIKIDRSFVADVDTRRASQAICSSVIALARGLGIKVLAEGVETGGEYRWLREHGCGDFQGFYFAPPLESEEFMAFAEDVHSLTAKLAIEPRLTHQRLRA